MKIKTTTKTIIKYELKYSTMLEGNPCIAEPNLKVLPLMRYDTKKLVDQISLNFLELFIIGKYVKI